MFKLEKDEYLCTLKNYRGGHNEFGINMARQMPYYHLYDAYVVVNRLRKKVSISVQQSA